MSINRGSKRKALWFWLCGGMLAAGSSSALSACSRDGSPVVDQTQSPAASPASHAASLTLVRDLSRELSLPASGPALPLRLHGNEILLGQLAASRAQSLDVKLPSTSHGVTTLRPIRHPEHWLSLEAVNATAVRAEVQSDGLALYPRAFGSADNVVQRHTGSLDQYLVIRDGSSPDFFSWKIQSDAGLRVHKMDGNRSVLVDSQGIAHFMLSEASVVGADGARFNVPLEAGSNNLLQLHVDHRRLTYPAVVHYAVSAPDREKRALESGNIIKGRVLVLLDTSGSMIWKFGDDSTTHGDSDDTAVFCDNSLGSGSSFACNNNTACTIANGGRKFWPVDDDDEPSRMLAAKLALNNVINAHSGLLDFGLERFSVEDDCVNADYCCETRTNGSSRGRCRPYDYYSDIPSSGTSNDLTFTGGCGSPTGGGRVLVDPGPSSGPAVLRWIDFVEDFCSSTANVGGAPRNPEIRGSGLTPLARSVISARTDWYEETYKVSKPGSPEFDDNSPLYDELIDCRPYVLVVMTDGINTCGVNEDPSAQVAALRSVNADNPVDIYVLGMGNEDGLDEAELNQMADAGGTGPTAPIAQNQAEIEAAFADIVSTTVKYEQCNGIDDTCNERIDEGLGVYQDCLVGSDCGSGTCDQGRCTCIGSSQCANNYTCAQENFCRPRCYVSTLSCKNWGVKKCGAGIGECCVDNGSETCDEKVTPPVPDDEECNQEDDDCDAKVDEGLNCPICIKSPEVCDGEDNDCDLLVDADDPDMIGTGSPCGLSTGACDPGIVECIDGKPVCIGAEGPFEEVCNGLDDDCDVVIDGMTQLCYVLGLDDPTRNVGTCRDGAQACTAPPGTPGVECSGNNCWGECVGSVTPGDEICDAEDNDCDAIIDEDIHQDPEDPTSPETGDPCCTFQSEGQDLCGVGICEFGSYVCAGVLVVCEPGPGPMPEICDNLDNDCNGLVDDVPGQGTPCTTGSACPGELQCDLTTGGLVCVGADTGVGELCNSIDDDCDGSTDEEPDVLDDPALGVTCEKPKPPTDKSPCKSGKTVCRDGNVVCDGFVRPGTEVCNGKDDDCDGKKDDQAECPGESKCIEGECSITCLSGEFPCPGGFYCVDGYCIPLGDGTGTGGTTGDGGSAGTSSGGSGGSDNGSGGASGSGGDGNGSGGDGAGGDGAGGNGNGDGGSSGTGPNGAGGSSINPGGNDGGSGGDAKNVFGLATGGGGCACRATGSHSNSPQAAWLVAVLVALGVQRRRRSARPLCQPPVERHSSK